MWELVERFERGRDLRVSIVFAVGEDKTFGGISHREWVERQKFVHVMQDWNFQG